MDTQLPALYAAFAKARAKFGPIVRSKNVDFPSKTGGRVRFSYAPLEEILFATVPALSSEGLAVIQLVGADGITTRLVHAEGGSIETVTPLPAPKDADLKTWGGVVTYIRRYAIGALLGIAPEDDIEDDEEARGPVMAKGAQPTQALATPADVQAIAAAIKRQAHTRESAIAVASKVAGREISSSTMLRHDEVAAVIAALEAPESR